MSWHNDQVSRKETEYIIGTARECLAVSGDLVEMGCYKGDTALLLAEVLRDAESKTGEKLGKSGGKLAKKLWIYDSFEGLPEKGDFDTSVLGEDFTKGELFVTKREVKERFLRAGLPVPVIRKGWFRDLSALDMPERIAFSFLDGDFYESIRDSLKLVGDLMAFGGVVLVHDYNNPALPGVKRAVDEWTVGRELQLSEFETIARIEGF